MTQDEREQKALEAVKARFDAKYIPEPNSG